MEVTNNMLDSLKNNITENIPIIISALIILIIGLILSKLAKKSMTNFLNRLNIDQPILNYTSYSVYIICLSLTVMIALSILGIPQATIFSIIGVAGVSLGLAFKESLSNLGSGYILLFLKPFKIGDYIEFSGIEGIVTDMYIFNTTLKTYDNKTIVIPNSKLTNQTITNYTKQDLRRVDIEFKLPLGTDIDNVQSILNKLFKSNKFIIKDKEINIVISRFEANALNIKATVWVKTDDYWDAYYSLNNEINKAFIKNKIDMNLPVKVLK